MKYILGFLILILIVLFETSVLPFFPLFGTQPHLLLVTLLVLQFLGLTQECYYGAFFGGLLFDLFTGAPLGFGSLSLLLLSGAVGLVRRFAESSILLLLLITFVVSIVFRAVQAFSTFNLTIFLKGGLVDAGLMLLLYPSSKYLLKSVFGKKELQIGT